MAKDAGQRLPATLLASPGLKNQIISISAKIQYMTEPAIIFEDENFLTVNKPSGWLTHGVGHGGPGDERELTGWLLARYPELSKVGDLPLRKASQPERPGIVHRLDKDTSGVILIPKTQEYFLYLKSLFKERKIKKTYLALVYGALKARRGVIEEPIGIKSGTIRRSVGAGKMLKPAATEYVLEKEFENAKGEKFSLVEVSPLTGRTHQIRVHLKHLGHPILGDRIYGRRKDATKRLMLHALAIEFESSPGKKLRLEAEPAEDFNKALEGLRPV